MTTIKLSGGDLGSESMLVRCDLTQASAPVQVDYLTGDGWEGTQYQCADTRHIVAGLVEIGEKIAARACEVLLEDFECDSAIRTLRISDGNAIETADTLADAIEIVRDWYDYLLDDVIPGDGSLPDFDDFGITDVRDLNAAISKWEEAIAEACGGKAFYGHGNYSVSAANEAGYQLSVTEQESEVAA